MDKRLNQALHRGYPNGQETYDNAFNIISHREIQIVTKQTSHYTPTRMATVEIAEIQSVDEQVEE